MSDPFHHGNPLDSVAFAVLDLETTGLSPAYGHRVCEVACLRIQGGRVTGEFESLVDPVRPISPGAFAVNQITPDMLAGAPQFREVAPSLLAVTENAVLVAHNAGFDLGFLVHENNGHLYLIAHCFRAGELRTFRLDRIVSMALESEEPQETDMPPGCIPGGTEPWRA